MNGATAGDYRFLGRRRPAQDGRRRVSAGLIYAGDMTLPGMVHARPVLSQHARARILAVNGAAALHIPGVVAVLEGTDLVSRDCPLTSRATAVLARDRVAFVGQPVAVVVAESESIAADAAHEVSIDYEIDDPVVNAREASSAGAPLVWPHGLQIDAAPSIHGPADPSQSIDSQSNGNVCGQVRMIRGDARAALRSAAFVVRRRFRASSVHQTYMEPHAVVASFDRSRGELTVYTGTQGPFYVRELLAKTLAIPLRGVRVVPMTVGGGFGAKYGILEPLAGATAIAVGLPVRLTLTRSEDFATTTPAPACEIELELGVGNDGRLNALSASVTADDGAFPLEATGIGGTIGMILGGHYRCPNVEIHCQDVLTNKSAAGAYRAPGASPAAFAIESAVDEIAKHVGQDPIEFRLAHVVGPGDPMGNGEPWPSIGLAQCLERLREHPAWRAREHRPGEGVGIALGCWPGGVSPAAAICKAEVDGTVGIQIGSVDISGAHSSLALIAAEVLQLEPSAIYLVPGDTSSSPYGPGAGGSQTTYSVAGAVQRAAEEVRGQLLALASNVLEANVDDLELNSGHVRVKGVPGRFVTVGDLARIAQERPDASGPIVGHGRAAPAVSAPGAAAHLVRVRVDSETGNVEVLEYVAVQDVGFALNPLLVEGQIHGGVAQGLGLGLDEAMRYDDRAQPVTTTLLDYAIPTIDLVPQIEAVIVENGAPEGPYGARIVGEPPVIPGAAALANAIADAVGTRITDLPMTPESIWKALLEQEQSESKARDQQPVSNIS